MYNISINGPKWRMTNSKGTTWGMVALHVLGAFSGPMLLASLQAYLGRVEPNEFLPSIFFHEGGRTMLILSSALFAFFVASIFQNLNRGIPSKKVRFGVENPTVNLADMVSAAFQETGLKGWVSFEMNAATMGVEIEFNHYSEDVDAPKWMLHHLKKHGVQATAIAR
jgi:hypothetical protein